MKKQLIIGLLTFACAFTINAQDITVDEIIDNYFENTGGYDNWAALSGVKMKAKVNQGGMEIPLEIVSLKGGKQYTKITFQGMDIMQGVFDGENFWNTNFQSMKPEAADKETTENQKLNANDFPEPLFDYKKKNYTVELLGTESVEGTETYKVKLTKEPLTIDGKEVEDVTFYFFDTENFVPILQESEIKAGPQKGAISTAAMSEYQEVDGLMFPFSLSQGIKGGQSQPIVLESIELNPKVEEGVFSMPKSE